MWCHLELNQGHQDFQSCALPTELWYQPFKASQIYIKKYNKKTSSRLATWRVRMQCSGGLIIFLTDMAVKTPRILKVIVISLPYPKLDLFQVRVCFIMNPFAVRSHLFCYVSSSNISPLRFLVTVTVSPSLDAVVSPGTVASKGFSHLFVLYLHVMNVLLFL